MHDRSLTLERVRDYYGKLLQTNRDLKTSACCATETLPEYIRPVLSLVHPEVLDKFYGCGFPVPPLMEGCTVLDLGCGAGRDSYLLSKLVGPRGRVIGVDMTDEQLAVARRHVGYHTDRFGFREPNVTFVNGFIEDLRSAGIEDDSVDVVISNCVVNLSPEKSRVYEEIFRVLKPGGEMYLSDIFAGRRVPAAPSEDPVLRGECLGGALYFEDFRRLLYRAGVPDYRVISKRPIALTDPDVLRQVGMIDFHSMTVRAFKLSTLEDRCEDFGQVAYYLGTVPDFPHTFALDDHHLFRTGMPMLVCSNTASMLAETRFAPHFRIFGDTTTHYGLFDCAPPAGTSTEAVPPGAGACC